MSKYRIGNVLVDDIDCYGMQTSVVSSLNRTDALVAFSMNGEGIANYNSDTAFKELIDKADIVHADGWSTMMAGRIFTKGKFPERVATTDCYRDLLLGCIECKYRVFFLGAEPSEIELAVSNIKNDFPDLNVVGFSHGFIKDLDKLYNEIAELNVQMIFVGMGRPRQERIALELKRNCPSLKYIKTCGGLFNFLSGKNPRAPMFLQRIGLEWLFRLCNEPRRLFFRYFWTNFYSIYLYCFKSG